MDESLYSWGRDLKCESPIDDEHISGVVGRLGARRKHIMNNAYGFVVIIGSEILTIGIDVYNNVIVMKTCDVCCVLAAP